MILKVKHKDCSNKTSNYICQKTKRGLITFYPLDNILDWWAEQFEVMGKSWISSDFGFFIEYMNQPYCEIFIKLKPENVISSEELTKQEMRNHNNELWRFYRKMRLDPKEMAWQGFNISNQISMFENK